MVVGRTAHDLSVRRPPPSYAATAAASPDLPKHATLTGPPICHAHPSLFGIGEDIRAAAVLADETLGDDMFAVKRLADDVLHMRDGAGAGVPGAGGHLLLVPSSDLDCAIEDRSATSLLSQGHDSGQDVVDYILGLKFLHTLLERARTRRRQTVSHRRVELRDCVIFRYTLRQSALRSLLTLDTLG